ncbi:Ankyrin repeat-containing [Lecanosticta acicola]|uniref:Ankyrin repeat-containing n=1 Tax=Lecanosticta acicola TaxID=111012 RepID=A0AAI8YV95_9PEZI|nr:Ankyrin repeat-containing [Lecanosticta acicola]
MQPMDEDSETPAKLPAFISRRELDCISTFDFSQTVADVRQDFDQDWINTLEWYLEKFFGDETRPSWYLHCSGTPRAGKTTFVAAAARHLRSSSSTTAVVTLFFHSRDFLQMPGLPQTSVLEVILRVLLRQLVERAIPLQKSGSGPEERLIPPVGVDQVKAVLRVAVEHYERTFVLIDDIQEIPGLDEETIFQEFRVLGIHFVIFVGTPLNRLSRSSSQLCDMKDCGRTTVLWAEFVEVPLRIEEDWIEQDLKRVLVDDTNVSLVMDASNGLLPLARLALDDRIERPVLDDFETVRDRMPIYALRYFNFALCRVKHQPSTEDRHLGLAVLEVVAMAGIYELSFSALLSILASQPDNQKFGRTRDRARISRVTQGWIIIDHQGSLGKDTKVKMFHPEAQRYLSEECEALYDLQGGRDMALLCLTELNKARSQSIIRGLAGQDPRETLKRFSKVSLLSYALDHWGVHFQRFGSEKAKVAALTFLKFYQDTPQLRYLEILLCQPGDRVGGTRLHLLADLGLDELIDGSQMQDQALNITDPFARRTAAMVACNAGHKDFVTRLLETEADFTLFCGRDRTALWYAVQNAHYDTLQALLAKKGSLVNLQDTQGRTALMQAVELNSRAIQQDSLDQPTRYDKVLRILLDVKTLRLDLADSHGSTALHVAAKLADHLGLERLLESTHGRDKVDIREQNLLQRTPMMAMLSGRCVDQTRRLRTARLLIKHGASTAVRDNENRTALHYAATSDQSVEIMQMLLAKTIGSGVNVHRYSPMQIAQAHGCKNIAKLLVKWTKDQEAQYKIKSPTASPLTLVAMRKNTEAIAPAATADGQAKGSTNTKASLVEDEQRPQPTEVPYLALWKILDYNELHMAVHNACHEDFVEHFRLSQNLNATTALGDTALHVAIEALGDALRTKDKFKQVIYEGMIGMLINAATIELGIANHNHERAIDMAIRLPDFSKDLVLDIVERALACGHIDQIGQLPDIHRQFLEPALRGKPRSLDLLTALLDAGASVFHAIGSENKTAREVALEANLDQAVIDLLEERERKLLESL